MKKIFLYLLIIFNSTILLSQPVYTQKDIDVCNSKFKLALESDLASLPLNKVIAAIGKSFLGTEYASSSLEKGDKEKLVVSLTGLDCYTFLESSLVLARCVKNGRNSFEDYLKELTNIRYRGGELKEYPSRLHYFSDWIFDMNKRGIGKDITKELGGKVYNKKINFMSTHISAYRQLKENPDFVEQISAIEKKISARKYYYVPQEEISKIESKINDGDIIGITTNVEGLDIAHTGIAVRWDDGRIHLMHAPNVGYKVQITEKPLADYIKGNKKQTGIMILRPL